MQARPRREGAQQARPTDPGPTQEGRGALSGAPAPFPPHEDATASPAGAPTVGGTRPPREAGGGGGRGARGEGGGGTWAAPWTEPPTPPRRPPDPGLEPPVVPGCPKIPLQGAKKRPPEGPPYYT